jgi:hypothetical protein
MPLTSPAVSALDLEATTLALWAEFLKSYFDGNQHAIGTNPENISFPAADLRFQEDPHAQPLNGLGIRCVWVTPSSIRRTQDTVNGARQDVMYATASWLFLVRVSVGQKADATGNPQKQCAHAAALLFALLQNSKATQPLGQKGIHHVRPTNPVSVLDGKGSPKMDEAFVLRMVPCMAQLRYAVLSQ